MGLGLFIMFLAVLAGCAGIGNRLQGEGGTSSKSSSEHEKRFLFVYETFHIFFFDNAKEKLEISRRLVVSSRYM